jgi:hypothetical protein
MKVAHVAVWDHPASEAFCGLYGWKCKELIYTVGSRTSVCKRCLRVMKKLGEERGDGSELVLRTKTGPVPPGKDPVLAMSDVGVVSS